MAGIKLFVDGTVDNGTAWLFEPDAYGESVAPFWPRPEEYAAACATSPAAGFPRPRTRSATPEWPQSWTPSSPCLPRCGRLHRRPCTGSNTSKPSRTPHWDGSTGRAWWRACSRRTAPTIPAPTTRDNWSTRLGTERANDAWRCADLRAAGTTLGLGSDWPIAPFEPLPILADAQLRRRSGQPERTAGRSGPGPHGLAGAQRLHLARCPGCGGVGYLRVRHRRQARGFHRVRRRSAVRLPRRTWLPCRRWPRSWTDGCSTSRWGRPGRGAGLVCTYGQAGTWDEPQSCRG